MVSMYMIGSIFTVTNTQNPQKAGIFCANFRHVLPRERKWW